MPSFGLGNFVYEVTPENGKANFKFWDPFDPSNTAEVSVDQKDFPEGLSFDSRQVADIAYDQCQRVLNEKRDARQVKEKEDKLEKENKEDAKARQAAQDFHQSAQDVAVKPAKEEKDGTVVYNDETPSDNAKDDKKKK